MSKWKDKNGREVSATYHHPLELLPEKSADHYISAVTQHEKSNKSEGRLT